MVVYKVLLVIWSHMQKTYYKLLLALVDTKSHKGRYRLLIINYHKVLSEIIAEIIKLKSLFVLFFITLLFLFL